MFNSPFFCLSMKFSTPHVQFVQLIADGNKQNTNVEISQLFLNHSDKSHVTSNNKQELAKQLCKLFVYANAQRHI